MILLRSTPRLLRLVSALVNDCLTGFTIFVESVVSDSSKLQVQQELGSRRLRCVVNVQCAAEDSFRLPLILLPA